MHATCSTSDSRSSTRAIHTETHERTKVPCAGKGRKTASHLSVEVWKYAYPARYILPILYSAYSKLYAGHFVVRCNRRLRFIRTSLKVLCPSPWCGTYFSNRISLLPLPVRTISVLLHFWRFAFVKARSVKIHVVTKNLLLVFLLYTNPMCA